jgi:hypothetical protein
MSDQPPYYPPDPEWQNNQQSGYGQYGPGGSSQPPTQYQPPYSQQPSYSPYAQPPPYGQQGYVPPNAYVVPPYGVPTRAPDSGTGFAIAGLVLGIIAIISSWYPICGLPLPILGIVMSALGRRSVTNRTMATVGLVLSIIALVIGFIISALIIIAATFHSS